MVLDFPGLFGKGIFKESPEDGQVEASQGPRRVPITPTILVSPLDNELNILDLQAATAITPVTYSGTRTDIFTDADGFVNTVDTGNTTAEFDTDKYKNGGTVYNSGAAGANEGWETTLTITLTAKKIGFINRLYIGMNGSTATFRIDIIQATVTLATDTVLSGSANLNVTFVQGDYTSLLQPGTFTIVITRTAGIGQMESDTFDFDTNAFSMAAQLSPKFEGPFNLQFTTVEQDLIIQSAMHTVGAGAENVQVVAYRNNITGTGEITADISFDNGANYLTDVPLETNTIIINKGTQLIVKINLKAGASEGLAECKGYGVAFWG